MVYFENAFRWSFFHHKGLDVCRLRKDMQNIIKILRTDIGQEEGNAESIGGESREGAVESDEEAAEADGLVIITALVTSCIR
jgi:hypothetical protein